MVSEPWALYKEAFGLADTCCREGDWDTLWTVYELAKKYVAETRWQQDTGQEQLRRLSWQADHPGRPYQSPYAVAERVWEYIVQAVERVPAIAARIKAEADARIAESEREAAEYEAARVAEREQKQAEVRQREAEAQSEREALQAEEAAYLTGLRDPGDTSKLGSRWLRRVVGKSRPRRYERVSEICYRAFPEGGHQHQLAEHLENQLWDLVDLGQDWYADERSLGWLANHFTDAGGQRLVFWSVVAGVLNALSDADDDQDDPATTPEDYTPEQRAAADKLASEDDARAAVRRVVREGRHANHREIAGAAADLCGGDAEDIRVRFVVPMSKARQIVKVGDDGKPLVNMSKRGFYVLA